MKKRIIVDLDAICADIHTPWLAWYNQRRGLNLTMADVTCWDMHKIRGADVDIYDVLDHEGFFRNLKPLPGAIASVSQLNAEHEVLIVTAAETPISYKEKVEWVRHHMPFLNKRQLSIMHAKHLIDADVIVDDNERTVKAFKERQPNSLALTITYPYNFFSDVYDLKAPNWSDTSVAWHWIVSYINLPKGECFTLPNGSCAAPRGCICVPRGG